LPDAPARVVDIGCGPFSGFVPSGSTASSYVGPYFFPDLACTTEADEQAAIDGGHIRPTRIDYVGTRR